MRLDEYIMHLSQIADEHGVGLEVVDSYNEQVGLPEVQDDDGPPVVVICDKA